MTTITLTAVEAQAFDVWVLIDGVYDEPITDRLLHYGDPAALVGKWAIELRVTP